MTPSEGASFSISSGWRSMVSMGGESFGRASGSALVDVGAGRLAETIGHRGRRNRRARAVGEPAHPLGPPGALVVWRDLEPAVRIDVRPVGGLCEHMVCAPAVTGLAHHPRVVTAAR